MRYNHKHQIMRKYKSNNVNVYCLLLKGDEMKMMEYKYPRKFSLRNLKGKKKPRSPIL